MFSSILPLCLAVLSFLFVQPFSVFFHWPFLASPSLAFAVFPETQCLLKWIPCSFDADYSGVARPGPTRACALPSALQALPSAISFESRDSTMDQTMQC